MQASASIPCRRAGLGYALAAFPKGGDAQALVKEIRKILAATVKGGLPPDLVEAAKKMRRTRAELKKNSVLGLGRDLV